MDGATTTEPAAPRRHQMLDGEPPPFARRPLDRVHHGLNAQAVAEVEQLGRQARHGVDEARHLDRLQVVEAELVACAWAEAAVGRVIRRGFDAAEAVPARCIVHPVVVQLAEPFLAEGEPALGAVDLEVVLHLAAGRDPVALDRPGGAALEHDEGAAHIVDLHGAPAALLVGTLGDHGHAMPHHLGDGARADTPPWRARGCRYRPAPRRRPARGGSWAAPRCRSCSPRSGGRGSRGSRPARRPRSSPSRRPSSGCRGS